MTLRTRLTDRLGIEHPIVLAPMGSAAGGKLASAVTAAGGLGLIGGGYGDPEWLEREFAQAGNARIGCGFITWSLARKPGLLDQVPAAFARRDHALLRVSRSVCAADQSRRRAPDLPSAEHGPYP